MAHDRPGQLARLLDRLLPKDAPDFAVVHLDAQSPHFGALEAAVAALGDARIVRIDRPVPVRWGHHSQLTATRLLLEAALTRRFDVAHLLSGTDWPVRSREAVETEIAANPGACFIECASVDQQDRMQRYWLNDNFLGPNHVSWKKVIHPLGRIVDRVAPPRSRPFGIDWRKGSTWWSLPFEVCAAVAEDLRTIAASGRLRFTACSDEHVIQTIVAARFGQRVQRNHRYIDWSAGGSSPRTLTRADLPAIASSGAWFARKVDFDVDDAVAHLPGHVAI